MSELGQEANLLSEFDNQDQPVNKAPEEKEILLGSFSDPLKY
jgi:hypothetical protein